MLHPVTFLLALDYVMQSVMLFQTCNLYADVSQRNMAKQYKFPSYNHQQLQVINRLEVKRYNLPGDNTHKQFAPSNQRAP